QRLQPLPEGVSGQVAFQFDGKSGNSEEEDYALSGRLNLKKASDLWFLIASREYDKANGVKDEDKSFVHGRWVHRYNPVWAGEAFVQYQQNEFTRLLSRYLAGGGVRYTAIDDNDDLNLALGAGAFYVKEEEDLSTFETQKDYLRFNSYISYKQQINDHVSIISTAYYQPRASEFDDFNILWNTSLFTQLSDRLKLQLALNVTHDSEPPENPDAEPPVDVDQTDAEYSVSIVYEF
ncbi:MAG: DUF481 domain-containing protein, partial [Ketobacteraceae bacterium]|nr:DUF481 domain-containing protein [Ketobacteraceae bacterium]